MLLPYMDTLHSPSNITMTIHIQYTNVINYNGHHNYYSNNEYTNNDIIGR
jgi:hypothetical protein